MAVSEVAEVVNVFRAEKSTGGEGVDRGITPLDNVSGYRVDNKEDHAKRTRSIQKPPLRSIIWKKSSYALDRNQSSLAISKFDQK